MPSMKSRSRERGAAPEATAAPGAARRRRGGLGRQFWRLWSASTVSNLGQGASAIAFPWLASTLTDQAFLIALVAMANRLPWLLFSLPAGALADRLDRRLVMVWMTGARALVVGAVALLVAADAMTMPLLCACALTLGFSEVLFDNTSQVLLPSVVERRQLDSANGRLMAAQIVADDFLARPLGGVLLALTLAAPFAFDAVTAVVAGALLLTLRGTFRARSAGPPAPPVAASAAAAATPGGTSPAAVAAPVAADSAGGPASAAAASDGTGEAQPAGTSLWAETREGVRWLWGHTLLRRLAIALAISNMASQGAMVTYVLFAQEVLGLGPVGFALLSSVTGVGALVGGLLAGRVVRAIGRARSLTLLAVVQTLVFAITGLASNAFLVGSVMSVLGFVVVLWNVTTVSLRQTLIPDRLLGRVNSVYRLLGWGTIPLGAALGGLLVTLAEPHWGREAALRSPLLLTGLVLAVLAVYVRRRLTERLIDASIAEAVGDAPDGDAPDEDERDGGAPDGNGPDRGLPDGGVSDRGADRGADSRTELPPGPRGRPCGPSGREPDGDTRGPRRQPRRGPRREPSGDTGPATDDKGGPRPAHREPGEPEEPGERPEGAVSQAFSAQAVALRYSSECSAGPAARTRGRSDRSPSCARKAKATDTSWVGRCTTSIRSPARIVPGRSTRKYAPGRAASANRLTQRRSPIQSANVAQGMRGEVASSSNSSPTRHRSPTRVSLTSMPSVVRFSPKTPFSRGWPNSAAQWSRSSLA
ncbi:MFS transporter [Streptomyces sp. 3MP-14]|uniref:MFS transporter n=1 Tax=Streptomyces mimosae TaxID=2586635 RepID=A0A5N5ZYH0_9ACTN|nr:MFS transporter [Streptomyces mimosae]KAB8176673.1 MFS transporter [Streptomyces sp. 3MP-14]